MFSWSKDLSFYFLHFIGLSRKSFANRYNLKEGDELRISLAEKEGYLEDFSIRRYYNLRSNERNDYSSDQVFANFREIKQGNLKKAVLFRSSSPINPKLGRAPFADKLIEEAGVATILNLTDSEEDIDNYLKKDNFNSPYYKSLLDKGNVALLNMSCDTGSQDFNQKFKEGLKFALEKEGPILVHCTEGQDRAGFVAAMLEALTGSSVEEIKKDYMTTYLNYYFFQEDSKQYEKIAEANILDKLREVTDLESIEQLENINLEEATEKYFIEKGA